MRTRRPLMASMTLLLVACGSSGGDSGAKGSTSDPTAASGAPALRIQDFGYHPSPLTVAPGTTVTVSNLDGSEHTVTPDTTGAFTAVDVAKGAPVTFTAPTAPGTYRFFCKYHSSMHGTLVVRSG